MLTSYKKELKRAVANGDLIQKDDRYTTPLAQESERVILASEKQERNRVSPIWGKMDPFLELKDLGLNQGQ